MVRLVRALARGIDDVATPAGGRLFAAVAALALVAHLLVNTALDGLVVSAYGLVVTLGYDLTLPVGPGAAVWLLAGAWLAGSWLLVVACRAFAAPEDGLTVDVLTRDALPATLRTAVATGVGGVLVLVGLVFGIAPGILLAAHLAFVPVFVAVDGAGLDDAVVRSWRLAPAERLRVLALTGTTFVVTVGVVVVGAGGSSGLGLLLGGTALAGLAVALVGVAVDVRRQHDDSSPGRATGRTLGTGV